MICPYNVTNGLDILRQNGAIREVTKQRELLSDHGHTQAHGIGQPREGLIVQTRGRRARTYTDERLMNTVRDAFPQTHVWHGDGLLPDDLWVLIPKGQREFAPRDEIHVTHGGLSLDEIVVPLVEITSSDRSVL